MNDYLDFAKSLALRAGVIMKDNFDTDLYVEIKSDSSPVTMVDKSINKLVVEAVKQTYPEHGLLGEEFDYGNGTEEYQWICDPLDGTKPYVLGVPNSVFMLALAKQGSIYLSVVFDPFTGRMFTAIRGRGAYCNDVRLRVNNQTIREGYVLIGAAASTIISAVKQAGGKVEAVSGSGYKCMMIARGKGIGYIKYGADFHDIAPASLIVQEAGGKVTGLSGEELDFTKEFYGAILSNSTSHQSLIDIAGSAK
jgi:fructose-1,6-bisphosphatase/inositol monophosphatase family enzyme